MHLLLFSFSSLRFNGLNFSLISVSTYGHFSYLLFCQKDDHISPSNHLCIYLVCMYLMCSFFSYRFWLAMVHCDASNSIKSASDWMLFLATYLLFIALTFSKKVSVENLIVTLSYSSYSSSRMSYCRYPSCVMLDGAAVLFNQIPVHVEYTSN